MSVRACVIYMLACVCLFVYSDILYKGQNYVMM